MIRKALYLAIFAILIYAAQKFIINLDLQRVIYNHAPGPCEFVKGIEYGSEDLTILSNGVAIISSGFKFPKLEEQIKDYKGRIFMYDVNTNSSVKEVSELKITGKLDRSTFHPVGLSAFQDKSSGKITLFVINNGPEPNTIEVFNLNYKQLELQHIKTITSPLIYGPNNIIAISDHSFYLTNFYYFTNNLVRILEFFLPINFGTVIYYDGNSAMVAADGLSGPNGINMSPDKKYLYVSNFLRRELLVYSAKIDHTLELRERIYLHTLVDNIEVEQNNGAVWIAGHLSLHQLISGSNNPLGSSIPSQVLRLSMKDGKVESVTEVYSNDGSQLKGSSVASAYKNKLLIGSIWHKLLLCEIKISF